MTRTDESDSRQTRASSAKATHGTLDHGARSHLARSGPTLARVRLLPAGSRIARRAPRLPVAQPRGIHRARLRHRRNRADRHQPALLGSKTLRESPPELGGIDESL